MYGQFPHVWCILHLLTQYMVAYCTCSNHIWLCTTPHVQAGTEHMQVFVPVAEILQSHQITVRI